MVLFEVVILLVVVLIAANNCMEHIDSVHIALQIA